MLLMPTPKGLVFTVDLSKLADRELPEGSEMTVDEYRRTIEAPIANSTYREAIYIDWGDGSTERFTEGAFPPHQYSAAGKYTITIRSVSGILPQVRAILSNSSAEAANPTLNITRAIIAIDHFYGVMGNPASTVSNPGSAYRGTSNLAYVDPRAAGQWYFNDMNNMFNGAKPKQPIESFCFDFLDSVTTMQRTFAYCGDLTGSLDGRLDNCVSLTNLYQAFLYCNKLSEPYIFWNEDGAIDTDKFPSLTADSTGSCYANCSAALRAQVPEAYGGTMTV